MQGAQLEVGEPSNKRTGKKRKSPSNNLPLSKDREVLGPDDSFDHYCQPTELYNYIRHRAKENPSFLNRCLNYRIKARNKRIKMRVSLSLRIKEKESVSPLYICLGRQSQNNKDVEKQHAYADYQVSGLFKFQSSSEIDGDAVNAKFKLPEVYKFAEEAQSGSLYILVFTIVKNGYSSCEANAALVPSDESMPRDFCLCGKASLEFLYATWDTDPSFISRQIAETAVTIDLAPHYIKREGKDWRLSIEGPTNSDIERLPMLVSAEEYGARERPPCLHYSSRDILSPDLATTMRYHDNKLIKTEATNDFSCPVCMIRCGSYKGVRYHMESFHDFFNYEYWADQVVNVTIKPEVLEVIKSGPKSRFSLYQIVGDLSPRQIFLLRANELVEKGDGLLLVEPGYGTPLSVRLRVGFWRGRKKNGRLQSHLTSIFHSLQASHSLYYSSKSSQERNVTSCSCP
ncbi:unnamed protein product [Lupinus luteus]|uniref:Polycomb protein VEFS-Box domain-containing protein n=1 Tax=Lupinus luteus TaxID=3873 RepID=A0AAV1X723_LUPLU